MVCRVSGVVGAQFRLLVDSVLIKENAGIVGNQPVQVTTYIMYD